METYENLDEALLRRRRMRARRRRLLYLRRALILLCGAAILALMIATPIWIVRAVRNARDDRDAADAKTPPQSDSSPQDSVDTTVKIPDVDESTVVLGSEVGSEYVVLLDMTDNRVVAAKNAHGQANPASITKVMTLLVAAENIVDLDAEYTVPWQVTTYVASMDKDASTAGLNSGDVFTMRELLYGCILPSGADAAIALADIVIGGRAADLGEAEALFARMMNERAVELGADETNFINTTGLHHTMHKTTAMDMALIMAAAMKNADCRQALMMDQYSSEHTLALMPNQLKDGTWHSTLFTEWLGNDRYGIAAGKTGYTDQALHTMASYTVGADGHEYVLVTMRVNGRDKAVADARYLFETYCR